MPQGANRRHKRQDEKAGENIVRGAGLGYVGDWAVLCRNVWGRLYGCGGGCLRSREDAGCRVGLTALPGTAKWRGFVLLWQRGKGSFRLSAALAPWSAAAFLRYMPTARLCHKAGQIPLHNTLSRPVCRRTSRQKESRHAVAERVGSKHPEKTMSG